MENAKKELELIEEIRSLFEQLKETEKDRIVSGIYVLPPCRQEYIIIAEKLIQKAYELSELNNKYDTSRLPSVLSREVDHVNSHEFDYYPNGKVKPESVTELKKLMRDATWHIKAAFMDVLGNLQIEYIS
jgi:hypothetical protein